MTHVRYMDRIRDYYLGQGYEKPYVWAHFEEVPFTPLAKPLAESRVALLSTSDVSPKRGDDEEIPDAETTVGNVYGLPFDSPTSDLYSRQESYDRYATSLDDIDSYLPLTRLREGVAAGRIGGVTDEFFNLNRGYSKRLMQETTAPLALERLLAAGADVAILTPV
ncbi:MAG: glycine/sarcosine/betaine reductase selenoprotein B family protein [Alphaproteobacteria bacterium]|nr:glycine/sarcosine/betaine reductase selenoprotein B family protein [Alphaproteobacteria bacterium]